MHNFSCYLCCYCVKSFTKDEGLRVQKGFVHIGFAGFAWREETENEPMYYYTLPFAVLLRSVIGSRIYPRAGGRAGGCCSFVDTILPDSDPDPDWTLPDPFGLWFREKTRNGDSAIHYVKRNNQFYPFALWVSGSVEGDGEGTQTCF